MTSFQALQLQKTPSGIAPTLVSLTREAVPTEGELWVRVRYSSLNYKDGLAVTNRGKIVRGAFPFVPGIDLVGEVVASESDQFHPGEWVIATGWGLGEDRWGGYSQYQSVPAETVIRLPAGMDPRTAMTIGTAGFTAQLAVMALEAQGVSPDRGEIVVTGASGGVGSMGVFLLAQQGYQPLASTGKETSHAYLRDLGAVRIIHRDELGRGAQRPLDSARWAGAVDSVGGATLAAVLSQVGRHGSVAACGLAGGASLETTVFPFILRGVNLLGIDSNTCPQPLREKAWARLASVLTKDAADAMTTLIGLADVPAWSERIVRGQVQGRVVVDLHGA